VAFIDEIFKANSAILNTLLTVLNERLFDNGSQRLPVPLITLVGASNELPESEELDALYDRFLVRRQVRQVTVTGGRRGAVFSRCLGGRCMGGRGGASPGARCCCGWSRRWAYGLDGTSRCGVLQWQVGRVTGGLALEARQCSSCGGGGGGVGAGGRGCGAGGA
jgi:hypothetical protein